MWKTPWGSLPPSTGWLEIAARCSQKLHRRFRSGTRDGKIMSMEVCCHPSKFQFGSCHSSSPFALVSRILIRVIPRQVLLDVADGELPFLEIVVNSADQLRLLGAFRRGPRSSRDQFFGACMSFLIPLWTTGLHSILFHYHVLQQNL
jgi:hypothetical protein